MDVGHRLAANVKRLRLERGWSQEELADRAGKHRTFISQIERVVKTPTIDTVDAIAKALGVTIGELAD